MDESICPFGPRLRELREKSGLNKSEAARRAGMARGALTRLERGLHPPDHDAVHKLAAALGVRPNDFLCPGWTMPAPEPPPRPRGRR